jgi:hypothetical protein
MTCPSELALEIHLIARERSSLTAHVASCARCAAELARMEKEGEQFAQYVFPRTLDSVLRRRRSARRQRAAAGLAAFGLAAAAALAIWVSPPGQESDYLGIKGARLGLALLTADDSGARELTDGDTVAAGAALRLRVRPAAPCYLWVVSVDSRGIVSRLYPASGDSPLLVSASSVLPGGVALDGTAGWERFFAVCSPEPLAYAAVEGAARAIASAAGTATRLPGLAEAIPQASIVVQKIP